VEKARQHSAVSNDFFGFAFALMSAHQLYETIRAITTKRVRRITFRRRYTALNEDPLGYWLATLWHGFCVVGFGAMSALAFYMGPQ
jgi:hypothetical protein